MLCGGRAAIKSDWTKDGTSKLLAIAYYMGREEATKEILDKHNSVIDEQKKRAAKSRYHNFADSMVFGPQNDI